MILSSRADGHEFKASAVVWRMEARMASKLAEAFSLHYCDGRFIYLECWRRDYSKVCQEVAMGLNEANE
jgi:hypothetical protein